jgi:hypothetical protein
MSQNGEPQRSSTKEGHPHFVASTGSDASRVRPLSNWAQIFSAYFTFFATAVAIWAIFFSPASQTVIDFLQSELTIRNSKISELEQSENKLRSEIESRQSQLSGLLGDISKTIADSKRLEGEKALLVSEREALKSEIEEQKRELQAYSESFERLRISYTAGKFYAMMRGVLVSVEGLQLIGMDDLPRKEINVWMDYVKFVNSSLKKMDGEERKIGAEIVRRFLKSCESVGNRTIVIGPVKAPIAPYYIHDYAKLPSVKQAKLEEEYQKKLQTFQAEAQKQADRIYEVEKKIQECMQKIN